MVEQRTENPCVGGSIPPNPTKIYLDMKKQLIELSSVRCTVCNCQIPAGRIKALPHTTECAAHSKATPVYGHTFCHGDVDDGFTDISIIHDPAVANQIEQLRRVI